MILVHNRLKAFERVGVKTKSLNRPRARCFSRKWCKLHKKRHVQTEKNQSIVEWTCEKLEHKLYDFITLQ